MSERVPSAEQRRAAERNARFYGANAMQFFLVGLLLVAFAGIQAYAGAGWWMMLLLFAFAAVTFGGALHRALQRRRRLKVARTGQLAEAIIHEVMRRPGMHEGNPNEYSMLIEPQIPDGEPVWIRAFIEPSDARGIFGEALPYTETVKPDDLRLPIVVLPASPKLPLLAVCGSVSQSTERPRR